MPLNLPHVSPFKTRDFRDNLNALRQLRRDRVITPEVLEAEIGRQLDLFRTNKQRPRGLFRRRKYQGSTSLGLATQKLTQHGSAGVVNWVRAHHIAPSTPVADVIGRVMVDQGLTPREFEMRLNDPARLLGGYIGGEDEDTVTCRQAYARLRNDRWASSCGQTSNVLKDLISDTWVDGPALGSKPGRQVLQDLKDAINNPANTHIRVQIGCHSFMIENGAEGCRLYQSYMAMGYGGYGLADSLATDRPIPRREFVGLLENLFDDRTNDAAAARLFRGTCDPSANAARGDFCVQFETTSTPRTPRQLEAAIETKLGENRAGWTTVRRSDELASAFALRNLT